MHLKDNKAKEVIKQSSVGIRLISGCTHTLQCVLLLKSLFLAWRAGEKKRHFLICHVIKPREIIC